MKSFSPVLSVALIALALATFAGAQKLGLDEVVANHLNSIAKADVREGMKTRFSLGTSSFESKLPPTRGGGKALVVSDSKNLMFLLALASKEYPFEKVGYFDTKVSLPFVTAGTRSPLGAFIADHQKLLSEGLFMGSLSSRWLLLDPKKFGGKLVLTGVKKTVGDRKAYVLEYFPGDGGSSEFKIRIFIDTENFHHIRTEYHHEIAPKTETMRSGLGSMAGGTSNSAGVVLEFTEDFDDFKTVNGITLPYSYHVKYVTDSNQGTYQFEWGIGFVEHRINQKLDPGFFTFDAN